VVLTLATVGACSDEERTPVPAAGCAPSADLPAGTTTRKITSYGFEREYVVYAPRSYTGRSQVPVVLEFHGYGASAQQQLLYGSFGPQAEQDGFLVVAPQGQGRPRRFTVLGPTAEAQDDVVFVADLLDNLQKTLCVDPARVYATGFSNGGAMSAVLACRLSERIAAFASVAAVVWGPECEGARTVPIIALHGTADPVVPFDGGRVNCCGNPTIAAVADTMASWAEHDGCAPEPVESPVKGAVTVRRWSGCEPGGVVELYVVGGGGHTWPGSALGGDLLGGASKDIDASAVIWDFFKSQRL
jgi:polyhydroxybutyrate depolymerase